MNDKKAVRLRFRRQVFERDGSKCRVCGALGVDAHHITDRHDFKNGGYVLSNGITVCSSCHIKAERGEKGLTKPELYAKIGSSFNRARLEDHNAR